MIVAFYFTFSVHFTRTLILCLFALLTIGHSSVPAQVLQLAELNTEQIRALDKENTIVLIPGGILEQHGPYLPSYTDGYRNEWATRELAQAIAARAAAVEERIRKERFAKWLTQQREPSQLPAQQQLPVIDMQLDAPRVDDIEQPAGAVLPADPLTPGEHEVVLRGINIWYLVLGSGPVLLIQPGGAGWGGDATIYIETLRPLEAEHTLVYYDPPGIGRSGRSDDPARYSLAEYVEDLEALRQHLGLDAISLAGHSHGGFVALKYAIKYPEHVEKLIAIGTGPIAYDPEPVWWEARKGYEDALNLWQAVDTTLNPDELHAEFIRIFLPVGHFHNYTSVRNVVEDLISTSTFSVEPFKQVTKEIETWDIRDQVAGIRAITLIVIGDDDSPDSLEGSPFLHEQIPNSQFFVVPESGHWPWIERPDLFFPAVLRFLATTR